MARAFDSGSNQYLEVTSTPVTGPPFSFAFWFNTSDVSNDQMPFSIGTDSNNGHFCLLNAPGLTVHAYSLAAGSSANAVATSAYTGGAWYHACCVYAAAADRRVYLNGGNKGTDTTSRTPSNATTIRIGARAVASGDEMNGEIAEAAIWNVALTDADAAMLAKGYSPLLVKPENLVFYCPLVRDNDEDIVGGLSLTASGSPTIAVHPRVLYAARPLYVPGMVAAAQGGVAPQWMQLAQMMTGG